MRNQWSQRLSSSLWWQWKEERYHTRLIYCMSKMGLRGSNLDQKLEKQWYQSASRSHRYCIWRNLDTPSFSNMLGLRRLNLKRVKLDPRKSLVGPRFLPCRERQDRVVFFSLSVTVLPVYFLIFNKRLLFPLIFFCSCSKPKRRASAVGGHPGT